LRGRIYSAPQDGFIHYNLILPYYLYGYTYSHFIMNRRDFVHTSSLAVGGFTVGAAFNYKLQQAPSSKVACQQYTWQTYLKREGIIWNADLDTFMGFFMKSGLTGFEPSFDSVESVSTLYPYLETHNIWTRSLYVNSTLYDPNTVEASIEQALAIAKAAKKMGVKIIVTNPEPIRWGGPENKNDSQLIFQAQALNRLGAALSKENLTLAYHTHDAEMREGAREFHHMLNGTDPAHVKLCLDAHWIYRGAGNSQVALFDIVDLYSDRIVELHLRQSHDGVWSETFGVGDIDYKRLADELASRNIRPHIVLEQAVEEGTPHEIDVASAQRESLAYVEEIFKNF